MSNNVALVAPGAIFAGAPLTAADLAQAESAADAALAARTEAHVVAKATAEERFKAEYDFDSQLHAARGVTKAEYVASRMVDAGLATLDRPA